MSAVCVGVAGLGAIGRKHVEVLRSLESCARVVIADPSPAAQKYAAERGLSIFGGIKEMLEFEKPDAVVVAVPTADHLSVATACIECGTPVLVEKPIADTLDAARLLVERAEEAGVPLLVGHHRRFSPAIQVAAEQICQGHIGTPIIATVLYTFKKPDSYFDIPWHREPAGGGPVLINLIHEIDQLRFLLGDVDSVQAMQSHDVRQLAVEDTAVVLLRFKSGVLATISISDAAAAPWSYDLVSGEWDLMSERGTSVDRGKEDTHFISGTLGSITLPGLRAYTFKHEQGWANALDVDQLKTERGDPYALQAAHFLQVSQRQVEPLVSGRDATRTLEVTLAIKTAARTGQIVRL